MIRKILYLSFFVLGWLFGALVPPPAWIADLARSAGAKGEAALVKKEIEIKKSLKETIQEKTREIEKKLDDKK